MQKSSSRIWTQVTDSIYYNTNHYIMGVPLSLSYIYLTQMEED